MLQMLNKAEGYEEYQPPTTDSASYDFGNDTNNILYVQGTVRTKI